MKAMDALGAGGSFTELYAMDFEDNFILMGHDGPFHLRHRRGQAHPAGPGAVPRQARVRRVGGGAVKQGPVTILGLTQTRRRAAEMAGLRRLVGLGRDPAHRQHELAPAVHGETGPTRFDVAGWMNRWATQGPTHHVALGVGHVAGTLEKMADVLGTEFVRV